MKIVLYITLLSFCSFTALSQSKDKKKNKELVEVLVDKELDGNYKFDSVFHVNNISKQEMYSRARKWVIANIKTNDNNIEFNDSEFYISTTPTIVIPPINIPFVGEIPRGWANFKFILEFKDNKYRLTMHNITIYVEYSRPILPPRTSSYNDFMATDGEKSIKNGGKGRFALDFYTIDEINKQIETLSSSINKAITNIDNDQDW